MAHDKATALLQKIPAGVVIVNEELKIVDMNRTFAACMGEDTLGVYDMFPGMEGASLKGLCPFESMFRTVLATGEELRERRINVVRGHGCSPSTTSSRRNRSSACCKTCTNLRCGKNGCSKRRAK